MGGGIHAPPAFFSLELTWRGNSGGAQPWFYPCDGDSGTSDVKERLHFGANVGAERGGRGVQVSSNLGWSSRD